MAPDRNSDPIGTQPADGLFIAIRSLEHEFGDAIADGLFALDQRGGIRLLSSPEVTAKELVTILKNDRRLQ